MTSKQAVEKISGLESRISELESDVTAANETIETLQGEAKNHAEAVSTLTTERDELQGKLTVAESTIADQESTVTEANAKLATFDSEVEAKALLQVASIGFQGDIPVANLDQESTTKLTRAQFNALSPSDRMTFVKSGGKIK